MVYIFLDLVHSKHVKENHQAEKAIKAMYEVIKKGRKHNISISCQLDLFDKLVQPILSYGCEILGFGNNGISERVQLKFCKLLLHLKNIGYCNAEHYKCHPNEQYKY